MHKVNDSAPGVNGKGRPEAEGFVYGDAFLVAVGVVDTCLVVLGVVLRDVVFFRLKSFTMRLTYALVSR